MRERARVCPVALLTDFGAHSAYVGQVHLALARQAPRARIFDLAHDLPAHGVAAAAVALTGAAPFLPRPIVVCAIVDPGVGSARRILAARFPGGVTILAPDNGLLKGVRGLPAPMVVRAVTAKEFFGAEPSPVFHGRDVFAPVAARVATGLPLARLGPAVAWNQVAPAPWRDARFTPRRAVAEVLYVDRFGNLVTNLYADDLRGRRVEAAGHRGYRFPFHEHYAQVERGEPLALIGSFGFLELALREASAAQRLDLGVGTRVTVKFSGLP